MECPTCGNTAFFPNSKFCQECGSKLPRTSVVPSTREAITKDTKVSSLNAKQADAGDNSDLGVDKSQFEGILCISWPKEILKFHLGRMNN